MGVSAPIIKVSVPSINLVQYKIPLNHLAKVIASEVDIDPTGEVGNSNRVRTGFSKRSIEDIGNIVIRLPNSQKEIFLRDISNIYFDNISQNREYFSCLLYTSDAADE